MGEEHAHASHGPGATATHDAHGHGHDPNLAHHWDNMDQQIEAGKFGMWLFLATEVLLFAGLFCAYAVYRSNHPEVFLNGEKYLSKVWGGINTIILLLSSFTVALAVRAASMGDRKKTVVFLALTVVGALGFLAVKTVEYRDKFAHGTLWGAKYHPHAEEHGAEHGAAHGTELQKIAPESAMGDDYTPHNPWEKNPALAEKSLIPVPPMVQTLPTTDGRVAAEAVAEGAAQPRQQTYDHIFFGIYFVMTGLHGIHVVIGMIAIIWVMIRANRGDFTKRYYLPVDLVGLYWHLVDLIWIYLFPLLYLIG
jgi:cytochrome c oxidase subunit III